MPVLGEEFRRAREARGLSISDVADRLHIRSVYLAAIEDEDWAAIGAPVYIRGFMRTYARFLGLDPENAIARLAEPAAAAPAASRQTPVPPTIERAAPRGPSVFAILAVLVALGLVGFVGYQYYLYREQPATASVVAPPSAEPAGPQAQAPGAAPAEVEGASAAPGAEASPLVAPAPQAAHPRLAVRLTETSWLRVEVDGKVVLEGTYPAGTAKSFGGKVAVVRVGNAGGVQIAVAGRDVGKLGADGDVVERRFVLSGE